MLFLVGLAWLVHSCVTMTAADVLGAVGIVLAACVLVFVVGAALYRPQEPPPVTPSTAAIDYWGRATRKFDALPDFSTTDMVMADPAWGAYALDRTRGKLAALCMADNEVPVVLPIAHIDSIELIRFDDAIGTPARHGFNSKPVPVACIADADPHHKTPVPIAPSSETFPVELVVRLFTSAQPMLRIPFAIYTNTDGERQDCAEAVAEGERWFAHLQWWLDNLHAKQERVDALGVARELTSLASLVERGFLSASEFNALKAKLGP